MTICVVPGCGEELSAGDWLCSRGHEQTVTARPVDHTTERSTTQDRNPLEEPAGEATGWTCETAGCGQSCTGSICDFCGSARPNPRSVGGVDVVFPDGRTLTLTTGGRIDLGRDRSWSPIAEWLDVYPNVSRRHITFVLDGSGLQVIDLKPTNGTFVNDRRVNPGSTSALGSGDKVRLGAHLVLTIQPVSTP